MYLDNSSNICRIGWKFNYKGSELLAAFEAKFKESKQIETDAREQLAALLLDPKVTRNDERCVKHDRTIDTHGAIAEMCEVLVHEAKRSPDREFTLAIGDVVFFDLQK